MGRHRWSKCQKPKLNTVLLALQPSPLLVHGRQEGQGSPAPASAAGGSLSSHSAEARIPPRLARLPGPLTVERRWSSAFSRAILIHIGQLQDVSQISFLQ